MWNRRVPAIAAAVVLLVHLAANAHYGFFRDELYFIVCGRHPQWGYVDQPPLVPLLSALSQIFGPSLFLLRAVPALFAAGGAYLTCLLVAEFGGGVFAQILAALVFLGTPVLTSFGMKVGTDEVGLLGWPLLALAIVRARRARADARSPDPAESLVRMGRRARGADRAAERDLAGSCRLADARTASQRSGR